MFNLVHETMCHMVVTNNTVNNVLMSQDNLKKNRWNPSGNFRNIHWDQWNDPQKNHQNIELALTTSFFGQFSSVIPF